MFLAATLLALFAAPIAGEPIQITTEHYELEWDGARSEAAEASRLLESSFTELAAFFGAQPEERMRVRVFRDEKLRIEGAWNDGITVPVQSQFASFSEETRTAYVARSDVPQATRATLLYAACLQFHSLSRSKNLDIGRTWYAWGIALDFSRSTWNGEKLVAFAEPRVELVDLPGRALLAIGDGVPDLARLGTLRADDPELAWAVAALCMHGKERSYRSAFRRYALGETGTKFSSTDFLRTLGPAQELGQDVREFVLAAQTPFEALGRWEDRGSAGIVGHGTSTKDIYCVLRAGTERLAAGASKLPKSGCRMGFVAGWSGPDDHARIEIEAPEVLVHVLRLGKIVATMRLAIPGDALRERHIELARVGNQYVLTVDGTKHELELPSGRMGFHVFGTQVSFRDVTWR